MAVVAIGSVEKVVKLAMIKNVPVMFLLQQPLYLTDEKVCTFVSPGHASLYCIL
jgi:hypothetical protein